MADQHVIPLERVERSILILRGRRVILDSDLADLYGVETRRLNEQVKRNEARFPEDFAFQLTAEELDNLKSHFATSSGQWGGRRKSNTEVQETATRRGISLWGTELADLEQHGNPNSRRSRRRRRSPGKHGYDPSIVVSSQIPFHAA